VLTLDNVPFSPHSPAGDGEGEGEALALVEPVGHRSFTNICLNAKGEKKKKKEKKLDSGHPLMSIFGWCFVGQKKEKLKRSEWGKAVRYSSSLIQLHAQKGKRGGEKRKGERNNMSSRTEKPYLSPVDSGNRVGKGGKRKETGANTGYLLPIGRCGKGKGRGGNGSARPIILFCEVTGKKKKRRRGGKCSERSEKPHWLTEHAGKRKRGGEWAKAKSIDARVRMKAFGGEKRKGERKMA